MIQAKEFIKFKLKAKNAHGIHSPFIFDLYNNVFSNYYPFYAFPILESLRAKLLLSKIKINVEDFGAGSKKMDDAHRKVSEIASTSALPSKYASLLFRMVNFLQPKNIIETGTSVGITTSYLALAKRDAKIYTFEGSNALIDLAQKSFTMLKLKNIETVHGKIQEELPKALEKIRVVDFAFIDADHRFQPTIHQFELLLKHCNSNSVLIFDDIYWSKEMTRAWETIKANEKVKATIDIFRMGMVFFKEEFKDKQHFVIRY